MDRVNRVVALYSQAFAALEEVIAFENAPIDIRRDATLLRFELVAELAPKTLRRILNERGSDVVLPMDVVREATGAGIIDEGIGETLLRIIKDRNRMVHDYNQSYANELFERITSSYAAALGSLKVALAKFAS